jgi:hypothetical protein
MWRPALASAVALVAVLGLKSRLSTAHWKVAIGARDTVTAAAMLAADLALITWLAVRARRAPATTPMVARLRTVLRYGLTAGAVALAAAVVAASGVLDVHWPGTRGPRAPSAPALRRPPPIKAAAPAAGHGGLSLSGLALAVGAVLLIAAAVAIAVAAARARPAPRRPEPGEPAQDYGTVLEEAVTGGRHALLALDDARAAIIACYQAMEGALARAGQARAAAETPDELLARAAATLVTCAGAAHRLTWLFYEARFSSHPLGRADRDTAEAALTELAGALAAPLAAPLAPATTPGRGQGQGGGPVDLGPLPGAVPS